MNVIPLQYPDPFSPQISGSVVRVFDRTQSRWQRYPIIKQMTVAFYAPTNSPMQVLVELDPLPSGEPDTLENDLDALVLLRERINHALEYHADDELVRCGCGANASVTSDDDRLFIKCECGRHAHGKNRDLLLRCWRKGNPEYRLHLSKNPDLRVNSLQPVLDYRQQVVEAIEQQGYALDGIPDVFSFDEIIKTALRDEWAVDYTVQVMVNRYGLTQLDESPSLIHTIGKVLAITVSFFSLLLFGMCAAYQAVSLNPDILIYLQAMPQASFWLLLALFGLGSVAHPMYGYFFGGEVA